MEGMAKLGYGDIKLILKKSPFPAINIHPVEEVAIKLEQVKTKHPQLHIECRFYKVMQGGGENSRGSIFMNIFSHAPDFQLEFLV